MNVKAIKKSVFTYLPIVILSLFAVTAHASTSQSIEDYLLSEEYYRIHANDTSAPVSISDSGEEFIDLSTGAVSYKSMDLSLPGKGGLDVNLVRRNKSDTYMDTKGNTKLFTLKDETSITTTHTSYKYVFRYYINGNTATTPVFVAYESVNEMLLAEEDGGIYTSSDYTLYAVGPDDWYRSNSSNQLIYSIGVGGDSLSLGLNVGGTFYNYSALPHGSDVHLIRDKSVSYGTITYNNVAAANNDISGTYKPGMPIAKGWYFENPILFTSEIALADDYNSTASKSEWRTVEKGRFIDPETGVTVCFYADYIDWAYSKYRPSVTSLDDINSRLVCYNDDNYTTMYSMEIKDSIKKEYNNSSWVSDAATVKNEFDYRIVIERYDGVKFYFVPENAGSAQHRLVKKEDRFGNSIYYYPTVNSDYGLVTGIFDTYDRHIMMVQNSNGSQIKKVFVNGVPALNYIYSTQNDFEADPNQVLDEDAVHQLKVVKNHNTANESFVVYNYYMDNQYYTISPDRKNSNNRYMGLYSTIPFPTYVIKSVENSVGGKVEYSYNKKIDTIPNNAFSKKAYTRVVERVKKEADGTVADVDNFAYNHSDGENRISTITKPNTDYSVTEKYNEDSELVMRTTVSETGQIKEEYTYSETTEGNSLLDTKTTTQYDADGNNEKSVTTTYVYNNEQQLSAQNDGLKGISLSYGSYGLLLTSESAQSSQVIVGTKNTRSLDGKKIIKSETYTNAPASTIKTYHDSEEYEYNANGDVIRIIKKQNGVIVSDVSYSYTYPQLSDSYSGGAVLILTETAQATGLTDADGTNPESKTVSVSTEYDIFGNVIKVTDAKGNVTSTEYDTMRRPVKVTNPDGTYKLIEYHDAENTIIQTDENGNSEKLVYDSLGRLWQTYVKKDSSWYKQSENSYDEFDRLEYTALFANNAEKGRAVYTYYNDDSIKTETVKEGNTILSAKTFVYEPGYSSDTVRKGVRVQTGLDTETSVFDYYDKWGRQIKQDVAFERNGSVSTYTSSYTTDLSGNILTATDYNGNVISYAYDYKNRVVKTTMPGGAYTETTYDSNDNPLTVRDFKGNITTMSYNNLGQLLTTSTPVSSGVTSTNKQYYDMNGNVTRIEQQNNKPGEAESYSVVRNIYDSRNRLVSSIGNDGTEDKITAYEYDGNGNVTKFTTGLTSEEATQSALSITAYSYDFMNNPISTTDALGKTSTAQYDVLGNMTSATDRNGNHVSYTYDALGRVKTVTAEDTTIAYEYNLMGQISKMTDSSGVTNYEYDGLGLLTKETKGNIIKTYDYDNNGNRTAFTLTENGEATLNITYTYDNRNRLASVTANGETTSYSYDANGNLLSQSTEGKASASYSYNNANQLTALTNTAPGKTVASYSVSYYLDGNKSAITESGQPTISYIYDGLGQLVSETAEGVSKTSYTYDSRQNRVSKTVNSLADNTVQSVSDYTYDLNNRLIKETETAGQTESTTDYYYDHNGNQITKLLSQISPDILEAESIGLSDVHPMAEFYTYDGLNRLSSATVNGKVTAYTYDGNNLRQTKTTDGIVTSHIYDGMNVVSDTVGAARNIYVRGIALISASFDGAKRYYHQNTHGDVIALTDAAGTISADYRYDAFGNHLTNNETDTNPFRYCGEYFDAETNNIYLRNRYYDTACGRFITEDPIKDGLNWYVYCGNNPIEFVDPSGLDETLDDYINQYYSGKMTVTIAIQRPVENSNVVATVKDGELINGHTFIRLDNGKGYVNYIGFAAKDKGLKEMLFSQNMPSKVVNDCMTEWNVAKVYEITPDSFELISNYINDIVLEEKEYNIETYNCTTVAVEALRSGGLNDEYLPIYQHNWTLPENVQKLIKNYSAKPKYIPAFAGAAAVKMFMEDNYGYTPSNAAQDLKNASGNVLLQNDNILDIITN